MFALYAFGLAVAVACAAATSRILFYSNDRRIGESVLRRDAETRPAPGAVSGGLSGAPTMDADGGTHDGAINIETTPGAEVEAAAAAMNAPYLAAIKRLSDIALSLGLLIFLAPILVVTIIAIKLDSAGPALYRQRRVGFCGRVFEVYKFRSMVTDAERNGPQYAALKDDRITNVGRFIRKFRIDEIPQAINVLRGEMSFVGPRPERPEFVRDLEQEIPLYHCRHLVKPGITGWAQVKYEYAASVEGAQNKLRYDLYYIRNFSPALDLLIVLMTVRVALLGLGSR